MTTPSRQFGAGIDRQPSPNGSTGRELRPVEPIDPPAPSPRKTTRFVSAEFSGSIEGVDVVVKIELDPRKLAETARYLKRSGLVPHARDWQRDADGHPICPRHNVAMSGREKQGDRWHSHKLVNDDGEEVWCRGRPGPDSRGWDVDA